jgi:predicted enzyme related to lactoylglutathione lyase
MNGASLFMVTLVVPDMDDGIAHFTRDWGFELTCDTGHVSGHRWVEVSPDKGARLRLVEATTDEHRSVIGRQTGGRVGFFLNLDEFDATIAHWQDRGIEVVEAARTESYGRVAVLRDKYGNRWDVFDENFKGAA